MRQPASRTIGDTWKRLQWWLLAVLVAYFVLFWPVLRLWVVDCWESDDFSYCLLVPLISAGILYRHAQLLAAERHAGGALGLTILLASLLTYFCGLLLSYSFLQRLGAFGAVAGISGYLFGGRLLLARPFPFWFLLFATPVPFVCYSTVSLFLQRVVTEYSASILHLMGYPALNEGNKIIMDQLQYGVVDACSGIRSIMVVFVLAILFTRLFRTGALRGSLLLTTVLPTTVAVNVFRIVLVCVATYALDVDLTRGTAHTGVGLLVFVLSLVSLYVAWRLIEWTLAPYYRMAE